MVYQQFTVFEACRIAEEIHAQLQRLTQDLTGVSKLIDLSVLPDLSYADLKHHHHPVCLLSEICRLLLKSGNKNFLQHCLALSHTIYAFKCQQNESWYISHLYKGIAQIGMKLTDLGVKNVSIGIAGQEAFAMVSVDQALGYWALMSAAIHKKNLKLAFTFAEKWQKAAQEGNLQGEIFRAKMAIQLFHLLFSEIEICSQEMKQLVNEVPEEWKETVAFLEEWTKVIEGEHRGSAGVPPGRSADIPPGEPYPLFLGIDWQRTPHTSSLSTDERTIVVDDFGVLCEIRRNFCHEDMMDNLSIEDIEKYANYLAQWELPRPLYDFETLLKNKAVEKNLHYIMTRLLGKQILQTVISKRPTDPNVVTQNEAIILVMDVRKFSALSEHRTPEEIFDLLNPVFKIMNAELEQAGGVILEFLGDCIIVVFNTFKDQQAEMISILHHTIRCLQRIRILNAMSRQSGLPEIHVGVGINKGPVALGYLGGLERCHLTVLGNTINLASRIESSTKELPGDVLVSEECFDGKESALWTAPLPINYSLRDLGRHQMRNIKQPVHLFGLKPLLRYWIDFVPMGFVAFPEKGVVYIDTGNSNEPGIIDHHFGSQHAQSACELLNRQPELLLEHLKHVPASQIEFRLHTQPDLDCVATLYTAYEFLDKQPRKEILWKLAEYVSKIDQGMIPHPERLRDSLKGIFLAHQKMTEQQYGDRLTDFLLLEAGLRVIDAAVYLMEKIPLDGDFAWVFQPQPEWFPEERRLLRDDLVRYKEDLKLRSYTYTARVNGIAEPVTGLWLDHPQSIFFKLLVRNDQRAPSGKGYPFLMVDWSQPGKNRFILSVAPESGTNLNGLGQLLEHHESLKRKQLGKERPVEPIRYPADNSDPWYFGQGHQYTIIDSPWEGTVLTAEEVQQIHESW
jgi:class 3 adenylate cyclase